MAARVSDAGRRIRGYLDTERVLVTSVVETSRGLDGAHASVWLTTGHAPPRFAVEEGSPPQVPSDAIQRAVRRCAARGKVVVEPAFGRIAAPIGAPRVGLLGVLLVHASSVEHGEARLVAGIADETGFALETANLFEHAAAEKERSDAILERVGDAVVVTDAHGKVLRWNPAAERTFGLGEREARGRACGRALGLHGGSDPLECSKGCALLAAQGEGSVLGLEVWRERPDGRRQPLLADVAAVRDTDGSVSEVVHSIRDITRLKEADEAKTMFLATASHELKTPLTVIQGFSETLLVARRWTPDEREKALRAMARRSKELTKIIDRLLMSSRIEAGRASVSLAEVDLPPILRERIETLGAVTRREIVLETGPQPFVVADPEGVATVLDHLLDNAMKYSPGGGPIVVRCTSDERSVSVSVSDGGIGMDREEATRCFDKFWQAESSDVRRFGGTGIGLFIVRSLVQAMGGSVTVASTPGKGSTFTVTLCRPGAEPASVQRSTVPAPGIGERSVIREFMRQIGIPERGAR